jgi:polysaccharide export outer membrane protein
MAIALAVSFTPELFSQEAGQRQPATSTNDSGFPRVENPPIRADEYVLGPADVLTIWVLQSEEISNKTYRVDNTGQLSLPLVGRLHAGGQTVTEFENLLRSELKKYIREPQLTVNVTDFQSQPISIIGAVTQPGVQQLRGRTTLLDAITRAGGLRPDAASHARIMRSLAWGKLPLPTAADDESGEYNIAEVNLRALVNSEKPEDNITLKPNDVITVLQAQVVFVIGQVARPGNYSVSERESLTVLQALSLAGGLNQFASAQNARILRPILGGPKRAELPVNLKDILAGSKMDIPLLPNDILLVPENTSKRITARVIEQAIQTATWMLGVGLIQ